MERDELYAKFESSIFEVQQKCGLQNLLLQRKVQVLAEKLEKKVSPELMQINFVVHERVQKPFLENCVLKIGAMLVDMLNLFPWRMVVGSTIRRGRGEA